MSLVEAVLTSTQNLCFEQKYGNYQDFLSENFQFLEVKFSIYLNRHVFVMECGILIYSAWQRLRSYCFDASCSVMETMSSPGDRGLRDVCRKA